MLMRKLSWDTQIKAFLLIVFSQIVSEIKLQKSSFIKLRAATCDFQQCGILASVNSDEPVQPPLTLSLPNFWGNVLLSAKYILDNVTTEGQAV